MVIYHLFFKPKEPPKNENMKSLSLMFGVMVLASILLGFGVIGTTQYLQVKAMDDIHKEPVVVEEQIPVTRPQKRVYMMRAEDISPIERIPAVPGAREEEIQREVKPPNSTRKGSKVNINALAVRVNPAPEITLTE
jgi:hypothetical protein